MPSGELIGLLYIVGFIMVAAGILILIISLTSYRRFGKEERRGEVGGVILIGPIPIVFGSSRRIMRLMLLISLIFIVMILLTILLPQLHIEI
ncbi:hypothetical protein DRO55_02330 [Candidatus Bathyarchaeota archaeon]|nr:MAG: hypothetical protein DRO55_02330 [Candidatus Bathyarchaeota archaeon]